MTQINEMVAEIQEGLIAFAQELVQIQSYSGQEEGAIRCVAAKMRELGYDEVKIDGMGNVLGRIGQGGKSILFDAHVDTVAVNDAELWEFPPFSGLVKDGMLHGRGSVDMKSAVAASVYAGILAKRLGLAKDRTIYVSTTVFEEDCDGENLKHMFKEFDLRPDFVMICEPSNGHISIGHKGKAQIAIKTAGVSAHGAAPEKGVNAIYEMVEIIQRVEQVNLRLLEKEAPRGTLVMSQITSKSASLNAVPSECEVYLDRRMMPGETEETVRAEIDEIIGDKNGTWEIGRLQRTCWTGLEFEYEPIHDAWKIDLEHELAQASIAAYQATFAQAPQDYTFWDFSTNAVTPVSLGIPTIGFGPGDYRLAHMRDERCGIEDIVKACEFYVQVCARI